MTQKHSYLKSAGIISLSTLASRILGLVRDIALASTFGAGMILDAFVLAFTIPNLFRRFFGEGALSAAFLPVFTEVIEKDGKEKAWELVSKTSTLLVLFLGGIVIIGVFGCFFSKDFFFVSPKTQLALGLTSVMIPYLLLICLTAFLSAVLNALHHFLSPALTPIILNITWLCGIFFVAPMFGTTKISWAYAMAFSILVGGVLQILILLPALKRKKVILTPNFHFHDDSLGRVFRNMGPVLIGAAVVQINVLIDRFIAWLMIEGDGALTVLYMGNRLMQFPLAIIGISLATVIFPVFTRYAVKGELKELGKAIPESIRMAFFLALPASAGLALLADPLISLIYQRGNFTLSASFRTTNVLIAYSCGLWVYILIQILSKAFFSIGDTKTPMRIAIFSVLGNFILNLILVPHFAEVGLAVATAVNAFGNFTFLLYKLGKKIELSWEGIFLFLLKAIISVTIMGIGVYLIVTFVNYDNSNFYRFLKVFAPTIAGIILYFFISNILAMKEIKELLKVLKK